MTIAYPGHKWNPILTEGVPDLCIYCDAGQLEYICNHIFGGRDYRMYKCLLCDRLVSTEEN